MSETLNEHISTIEWQLSSKDAKIAAKMAQVDNTEAHARTGVQEKSLVPAIVREPG